MQELRRFRIILLYAVRLLTYHAACSLSCGGRSLWRFSGSDLGSLGSVCGFGAGSVVSTYTVITRCGDQ